ncbi:TonB-dependent receptor [Parabacteroides sp. OttesenSCG-928-K15]|nr:TonB-dependent receptor [Parabacteroides sp. OttesenSCG-928-K15]
MKVSELFDEIEKQTDFLVVYSNSEVDLNHEINVKESSVVVASLMQEVLPLISLNYEFENNYIIISKKPITPQQPQNRKRIRGTITDFAGEPVIGANVVEKGTSNGVVTNVDGEFDLMIQENALLQVSYIGYITQEVATKNMTDLSILLQEDSQALDEVVVVGYGTQKKINLTGSVEVIGGEKLESRPVVNVTQALQGQVSGANFSAGTHGFEPGTSLSFQIRGQGSAYVLVDGVPTELGRINPNDIESISILKDAAAASIYGAMASYGVVLITTKSGKKDQKPIVSFSSNISSTKLHRKPQMVDSYTFARMLNEAGDNGGGRVFNNETIDRIIAYQNDPTLPETVPSTISPGKWAEEQYTNANHDWFDEYYGTGLNNQENISVRGGSKIVSYYVSAGHAYDSGILNYGTDNYRRVNTTAKVNVALTDWWDFSVNNRFQKSDRIRPNFDNQGDYDLLFHQIARTFPSQAKYTPNGYYTRLSKIPWTQDAGTDETIGYEVMQRFATEIRPLKGWSINVDFTFRLYNSKFTSNNFTVYEDIVDGTLVPIGTTQPSYVQKNQASNFYTSLNAYTTYQFSLNEAHNFALMAGVQQEQQRNETLAGRKNDIVTNEVPAISTSTGEIHSLTDNLSHWSRLGAFFRVGYNYKERYLLELNCRYDGTSVFAQGNRWGAFPSFSGGWNISRENFFEGLSDKINNLKLRASWGSLGNQNVSAYQDLALLGINSNLGWLLNGARPIYVTASKLVNKDLTWETSETLDFGLDIGLLNNRLNFSGDWYQRRTRNRLGPAEALPAVIGASIPQKNNSELKTNGWEITLGWRNRVNQDFSYSITAMLWDYYSVVTKYNNPTKILTTSYVGQRIGNIWGYTTDGLIKTEEEAKQIMESGSQKQFNSVWRAGDVKYADLDGDGFVNNGSNTLDEHGDLRIIGNTTPRYQYSLNLGASYKGLDLSILLQGVGKRDLWINSNMFWGFDTWNQSSLFAGDHLDYFRDKENDTYVGLGINTDSYFPRPYLVAASNNKNRQTQTRFLQNGSYLRLKNAQLGYTLPSALTHKIALSKVRFYFSGDNLLTLTGRFPKSLDPETATHGQRGHGKSMNAQSMYSFGIEIEF